MDETEGVSGEPVLIVEDNPQNLKLVRLVLRGEGYDVRTAVDAETALAELANFSPRLILMDLRLPGMDGLELTRHLKTDPERCSIAILAVTAYSMQFNEALALAAGCDGYLAKPLDITDLPRRVRDHLQPTPTPAAPESKRP